MHRKMCILKEIHTNNFHDDPPQINKSQAYAEMWRMELKMWGGGGDAKLRKINIWQIGVSLAW